MTRKSQGRGGGPKRRIRTMLRSFDKTTCAVMRNRSIKQIPANWRELLVESVYANCDTPPKHFYRAQVPVPERKIPRPGASIALGSLPTGIVVFTLDRQPFTAYYQRRAIDWALSLCDVSTWSVPKPSAKTGKGGECFINTGLYLSDGHSFNAFRLSDHPDIDWKHLVQYTARRKKAEYLGIRTTCGKPCSCRSALPSLWQLGWEMHY